jgi:hypothetical protein
MNKLILCIGSIILMIGCGSFYKDHPAGNEYYKLREDYLILASNGTFLQKSKEVVAVLNFYRECKMGKWKRRRNGDVYFYDIKPCCSTYDNQKRYILTLDCILVDTQRVSTKIDKQLLEDSLLRNYETMSIDDILDIMDALYADEQKKDTCLKYELCEVEDPNPNYLEFRETRKSYTFTQYKGCLLSEGGDVFRPITKVNLPSHVIF